MSWCFSKIRFEGLNEKVTSVGLQNVWIWMVIKIGFGILSRTDFMNGRIEKGSHSKSCTKKPVNTT